MTLNEAHKMAVHGDRKLRIKGIIYGDWFQDYILDYVSEHKYETVRILSETNEFIEVEMT